MRLPPTESRLSSAEDEGPFLTGEGILAASISRQNEFFMILLSALLEIFLELLEDEADDESEGDDWRQLYKNRSSRKINSWGLFSRE